MHSEPEPQLAGLATDPLLLSALSSLRELRASAAAIDVDQRSVAVLPFVNLSGEPNQQYLSDGITEDIMIRLARFRELKVAVRSAAFRFHGSDVNSGEAARLLGVRYVVKGTALKSGSRLVVSCQLLEAANGNVLWGERYDREVADIFQVQDEVTGRIATALGGRVMIAGASSVRRKPTESWSAYDYFLRGRELSNAGQESESEPYFGKAIALDPDFAMAVGWRAIGLLGKFWNSAERPYLEEAERSAQIALSLDPEEPRAHHAAGMALNYLKQYGRSAIHFKRAIELNPLDVSIGGDYSSLLLHIGRTEEALATLRDALQRDPFPPAWLYYAEGKILFFAGRYEDAIRALETAGAGMRRSHTFLAACHAALGNIADAKRELGLANEGGPGLSSTHLRALLPFVNPNALDFFFEALRKAGFTE